MNSNETTEWDRKSREAKQFFFFFFFFWISDYQCFNERPLSDMALEWATGDDDVIDHLYDIFRPQMTDEEWELVLVEIDNRLLRVMLPKKSQHNARAPASFAFLPRSWCT
jgi:hypothetical protein